MRSLAVLAAVAAAMLTPAQILNAAKTSGVQVVDTATFRYRVLLISHEATTESLNQEADEFADEYKSRPPF
jgi:hypothetical protein